MDINHLRSVLKYDPETGIFTRLHTVNPNPKAQVGQPVGTRHSGGYWQIRVGLKRYLAHRLAWFYVHGEWPTEIDHINKNKTDNRICNLRQVEHVQNMHNLGLSRHNKSGIKGVSFDKATGKWAACFQLNGRTKHLGRFASKEEAAVAHRNATSALFAEAA